jgi:invasion protein IalB
VRRRRSSNVMENHLKTLSMNTRRTCAWLLPLAAIIVGLTVIPTAARSAGAQPAAAAPAQPAGPQPAAAAPAASAAPVPVQSWIKTCATDKALKKDLCVVTEEIRADSGTLIVSVALRQVVGDKKFTFLATVPLGMLLKPGLKVQVDGAAPVSLVYGICDVHACYGLGDVDDAFVSSMKGGKALALTTYSQQAKAVNFSLPLASFAGALASKGLDPAAFQKLQEARVNQLKAKADVAREALVKQQQQQTPGSPAPAQ